MNKISTILLCLMFHVFAFAQFEFESAPPLTADELAQKIAGKGVEVFNVTKQCADDASGFFFNGVSTGLGLEEGILLTTGSIYFASTSSAIPSTYNGTPGDADVENTPWGSELLGNGSSTDACILEFDFIPSGNEISLSYIFASEEYEKYYNNYEEDVMAIFIEGGIEYPEKTFISLVPNSSLLPVSVSYINPSNNFEYYGSASSPFQDFDLVKYYGYTVPLIATATVSSCQTYHLKLVIADNIVQAKDSGLFVEENSFKSSSPDMKVASENLPYQEIAENCGSVSYNLTSPNGTENISLSTTPFLGNNYQILLGGTAVLGEDYEISTSQLVLDTTDTFSIVPIADNLIEGVEEISVSLVASCNNSIVLFTDTIYLKDVLEINTETSVNVCESNISIPLSVSGADKYNWTPTTGLSCTDCPNPIAIVEGDITYTVFGERAGCIVEEEIEIVVDENFSNATVSSIQNICSTESFTLEATGGLNYEWNAFAQSELNYLSCTDCPNPTFQPPADGEGAFEYDVTISSGANCSFTLSTSIEVTQPDIQLSDDYLTLCKGETATISVSGSGSFTWLNESGFTVSNGAELQVTPIQTTEYQLIVAGGNCPNVKKTVLIEVDDLEAEYLASETFVCENGEVNLTAISGNNPQWLDSEGNLFSNESEITVFPSTNTNYQLVVSNENCIDTATVAIAVEPIREVEFITPSPRICGELPSVDIAVEPIAGVTFEWEPAEYFTMSSQDGSIISATPPQGEPSFEYTVTPITALGCSPSASIEVEVSDSLEITVDAPQILCVDLNNVEPILINAFGAEVYLWEPFGPVLPTSLGSSEALFIPNPANNDIVFTVYGEDEKGNCYGQHSFQIQVIQQPDIEVNVPVICEGEVEQLSVEIEGGSGDFEYEWIPTIGLNNPNGAITEIDIESSATYTLIAKDLVNGCEISQEVFVEVYEEIEGSIAPNTSICQGEEATLSVTGIEEGVPISWIDDSGNTYEGNNIVVSPDSTTTFNISFGEICPVQLSTTVEVPNLDLQINAPQTTICKGESVELTATGAATFAWLPAVGINDISAPTQVLTPTETTTYRVTGFSANGQCSESMEITIKVNAVNIVSPLNVQICGGEESSFLEVDGGEEAIYSWTPSMGLSNTNSSAVIASPLETTVYTVKVNTADGCQENINFLVEVFEEPSISVFPTFAEVCKNKSHIFTLSGGVDYNLSVEENQEFDLLYLDSNRVEVTAKTDLNLTIEGTDENGCTATTQAVIEVVEPILALSENQLTCSGGDVELFADGGEGASYSWTPAHLLDDPTSSNPTAILNEETAFTVEVTNSMGCSDMGIVVVATTPPINAELTAASETFCSGESITLTVEINEPQLYVYEWYENTIIGELLATTGINSLEVTPSATTTYVVVIYDSEGCEETQSIELTLDNPSIEVQNSLACIGGNTTMSASGLGPDGNYQWQPAEFINCLNPNCSVVETTPFFEETNIEFTVSATNAQGCEAETTAILTVSQDLNLMLSVENPSVCIGETLQISAGGASEYTWQGEGLNTTTGSLVTVTLNEAGTYNYTLTGIVNDCEADLNFTVTANELPQIETQDLTICNGENIPLEAPGTSGLDYQWLDENGNEITDLTVSPTQTTTYTVLGTDENGCQTTAILTVNVSETLFEISATTSICEGESATLTGTGTDIVELQWSTGETTLEGEALTVTPSITTTYGVTATNSDGCTAVDQITIEVNPIPSIELTDNYLACENETLSVEASIDSENHILQWSPSTGIDNPTTVTPTITTNETTTYTLTATTEFGCEYIAATTINITDECVFPGDTDNNGEVNMFDLFPIGANFGESDFARNSISNEWQGFGVLDWSENQSNGENLKYVDCNGNGSIGFEDTTAIVQNFGFLQKSGGFQKGSLADPELRFVPTTNPIGAGEIIEMQVWFGSEENPATDLYAIAFETTFDTNLIDPNSITMDYSGSDLGTKNMDLLAVDLVNEETGRVNVSMSRIANSGSNGEIYLLSIRMRTLESIEAINDLTFHISDFGATNSNEEQILANTDELPTITIDPDIVDIEDFTSSVKPYTLFPTFTQDGFQLSYVLQKSTSIEVSLFDLSGQKMALLLKENQILGNHQEEIDLKKWNLAAGVYIVELKLDGKVYREKVVLF